MTIVRDRTSPRFLALLGRRPERSTAWEAVLGPKSSGRAAQFRALACLGFSADDFTVALPPETVALRAIPRAAGAPARSLPSGFRRGCCRRSRRSGALAFASVPRSRAHSHNRSLLSSSGVKPVIYCADIGSVPNRRFGWARSDTRDDTIESHRGGTEIIDLVDTVAADIAGGPGRRARLRVPAVRSRSRASAPPRRRPARREESLVVGRPRALGRSRLASSKWRGY
jgi:hypothetical protein